MSEILQQIWSKSEEVKEFLSELWLSKNEIDIYIASLSLGQSTASSLATKIGIKRSTAQHTCKTLVSKKMMSSVKQSNSFLYWAENPDKIVRNLKIQEDKIKKQREQAQDMVQNLNSIMNPIGSIPQIKYYHGVDGIIEIMEDHIAENSEIYWVLRVPKNTNPEVRDYVLNEYLEKRVGTWKIAHGIVNENAETAEYLKYDKQMNRITMIVPEDDFFFSASMQIYGNKVAFFSFEKNDLVGIIIEDELIRKSQFALFKMWWEHAKKYNINHHYKHIKI